MMSGVDAGPTVYSITTSVTNGTYSGSVSIVENGTATVTLSADSGYELPSSITVSGASYTYSNGVISLSNPTGNVTISAVCEEPISGYRITVIANGNDWTGPSSIEEGGTATIVFTNKSSGSYLAVSDITVTGATQSFTAGTQTLALSNPTSNITVQCRDTSIPTCIMKLSNNTNQTISRTYTFSGVGSTGDIIYDGVKMQSNEITVDIPPTNSGLKELKLLSSVSFPQNELGSAYPNVKELYLYRLDVLRNFDDVEYLYIDIPVTVGDLTQSIYYVFPSLTHMRFGPSVIDAEPYSYTGTVDTFRFFSERSQAPLLETVDCDSTSTYMDMRGNCLVKTSTNKALFLTGSTDSIPNSITAVGSLFDLFYKGDTLTIPSSVTTAFGVSPDVTTFNSYAKIVKRAPKNITTLNLYNTEEIGEKAFNGCLSLPSITLPSTVKKIGYDMVSTNSSAAIKTQITSVGSNYYLNNSGNAYYSLFHPYLSSQSPTIRSGCVLLPEIRSDMSNMSGAYGYTYGGSGSNATSITFPSSVKRIPESFCRQTSSLTSVTLNSGLTEIAKEAFCMCSGITSISIPATVEYVGEKAFASTSGSMAISEITFNQGPNDPLTFGTQVFKVKTSRSMTIKHKGNQAVLNYNWSGDGITPTFQLIS